MPFPASFSLFTSFLLYHWWIKFCWWLDLNRGSLCPKGLLYQLSHNHLKFKLWFFSVPKHDQEEGGAKNRRVRVSWDDRWQRRQRRQQRRRPGTRSPTSVVFVDVDARRSASQSSEFGAASYHRRAEHRFSGEKDQILLKHVADVIKVAWFLMTVEAHLTNLWFGNSCLASLIWLFRRLLRHSTEGQWKKLA